MSEGPALDDSRQEVQKAISFQDGLAGYALDGGPVVVLHPSPDPIGHELFG